MLETNFPKIFKYADIIPIHKKGDKKLLNNYRPIATLHNLSKVFENIILNRILDFCDKFDLLPAQQFGFRKKHSTKDAILNLFLQIETNFNNNKKSCCIFLDLSKAFDTVVHEKLLDILFQLGFRGVFGNLIRSYLSERFFRVKVNSSSTIFKRVLCGVPQGSILSPILYTLYVHKLSSLSNTIIQYADDTTIIIPFSTIQDLLISLQCTSTEIDSFMNDHGLKINVQKTEIVLFGEKKTHQFSFLNDIIISSTFTKFLGLYISADLKFDHHIEKTIIPNIRKHFHIFYHISGYLDKHSKYIVFNAFICPLITYATPFLLNSSKGAWGKLNKTYNRAIKILFHLPTLTPTNQLPHLTNISSLSSLIKIHSLSYTHRIFHFKCPLIICKLFTRSVRSNFILKSHSGYQSLHNTIAEIWNVLPSNCKAEMNKNKFKHTVYSLTD